MAYRADEGLFFLKKMKSKDLNHLVHCLTRGKDGELLITEDLTTSDEYIACFPNHIKYVNLIIAELQCYGANTIATMFRGGEGVLYKEILIDVCNKLKVTFNETSSISLIEDNLLKKLFKNTIDKMSKKERIQFAQSMGIKNISDFSSQMLFSTFLTAFNMGGFASYQYTVIIANAVMRGLFGTGISFAGNAALTKGMSILTGPIGWIVTGIWTAIDIASPASRVTIPAVIQIATLRKQYLYNLQNKNTIKKSTTKKSTTKKLIIFPKTAAKKTVKKVAKKSKKVHAF